MSKIQEKMSDEWSRSLESFNAKDLVFSIIRGARVRRKVIKFKLASKRAEVILGSKDACQIFELQAQTHMKRYNAGIHKQKILFDRFFEEMKQHERRWSEYVESDNVKEHMEYARNFMILQAIFTDGRPKEAEKLIQQFDASLKEIRALTTIDAVQGYVQKTLELKLAWQIDLTEFWWKLCVILHRDEIAALLIIWLFYCLWAAFQDNPEVTCTEWWDNAMWEACGVPHGDFDWEWFQEVLEADY